jgi:hypothetical protein
MTSPPPGRVPRARPLTSIEAAVLDALLANDFPSAEQLRTQAAHVRARRGCTCGCGTIDFVLPGANTGPLSEPSLPVAVEGIIHGEDGEPVGGILLFVAAGRLHTMEVYAYANAPLLMPTPDSIEWSVGEE